jgi:hypothetical protein
MTMREEAVILMRNRDTGRWRIVWQRDLEILEEFETLSDLIASKNGQEIVRQNPSAVAQAIERYGS